MTKYIVRSVKTSPQSCSLTDRYVQKKTASFLCLQKGCGFYVRLGKEPLAEEQPQIVLHRADAGDSKALHQDLCHIGAEECGQRGTQVNVLHP